MGSMRSLAERRLGPPSVPTVAATARSVDQYRHAVDELAHADRAEILPGMILRRIGHRPVDPRQLLQPLQRVAQALARAVGIFHRRLGDQPDIVAERVVVDGGAAERLLELAVERRGVAAGARSERAELDR